MRQKTTRNLFLVGLLFSAFFATAQPYKVETVKMKWDEASEDKTDEERNQRLQENLVDIEAAKEHPKTANDYKMWYYRGVTFITLHNSNNEELKAKYPNALDIATECFFNSMKVDAKERLIHQSKKGLVNCAIGHYNKGVNALGQGNYKEALASYQKVIEIFPYDEDEFLTKQAQINKETLIYYSAYAAGEAGDLAKAKELLNQLINQAYADPRIYSDMADILLKEKDTTGALSYIAKGREMYEDNAALIKAEIDLMMKLGRSQELIDKLEEAIKLEPDNAILYFASAINYYKLGDLAKAEANYKKVIEVDPAYADAYYNLGVIYLDQCKPIAEKIETVSYDESLKFEEQIDKLYAKAAEQFTLAMEVGDYTQEQKIDLAQNLKKLYGRLKQNDPTGKFKKRYDEMKSYIEAGGQ